MSIISNVQNTQVVQSKQLSEDEELFHFIDDHFDVILNKTGTDDIVQALRHAQLAALGGCHNEKDDQVISLLLEKIWRPKTAILIEESAEEPIQPYIKFPQIDSKKASEMIVFGWDHPDWVKMIKVKHGECFQKLISETTLKLDQCLTKYTQLSFKMMDEFLKEWAVFAENCANTDLVEEFKQKKIEICIQNRKDFDRECELDRKKIMEDLKLRSKALEDKMYSEQFDASFDMTERTKHQIKVVREKLNFFNRLIVKGGKAHFQVGKTVIQEVYPNFNFDSERNKEFYKRWFDGVATFYEEFSDLKMVVLTTKA